MHLSTSAKIGIARFIYQISRFLRLSQQREAIRNQIRYQLDLSEGIDLSIFLFGSFQGHLLNEKFLSTLPSSPVIMDVGANIGAFCLPAANTFPTSRIIAIEPTHYAVEKLRKNISLNEGFDERIEVLQSFMGAEVQDETSCVAYSSWKVDGSISDDRHEIHRGTPKEGVKQQNTIDRLMEMFELERLDFVKIDTDGYELEILRGGVKTFRQCTPLILFELSLEVLESRSQTYREFEELLFPMGYEFFNSGNGREITEQNVRQQVPQNGSIDVVAVCKKH